MARRRGGQNRLHDEPMGQKKSMGLPPTVELCIPIASDDESFAPHDDVVLRDPPAARSFPHDVDNTDRYVDKSQPKDQPQKGH